MSTKSIDHALLMALGLSRDSAEIVMDEIDMLRKALKLESECLEQMTMGANQLHKDFSEASAMNLGWSAKSAKQSAEIEQLRLELGWLKALRTRLHNIGTGAETTPSDNEALILGVKLIEASYSPPIA